MHPECKKYEKFRKITGYILDVLLALAVFYAAVYLLRKGTVHYRPESQWPLGILTGLPLVFRPRKKATVAELLLHDVLVLLAASSFGLLLTEYVVKGGIIIGNTAIWQGYVYHAAIFGIVYLLAANIRLTTCIGMGLTLVYALIDHYVTVFRGTPVLLSDVFAIGTAKNVASNYSVPVELSVLTTVGIAAVFCIAVWRVRRPSSAPRRWQFFTCSLLLACWLCGYELAGQGFGFWQGNLEYSEWYYFCRTAGNAIVQRPKDYTDTAPEQLAAAYQGEEGEIRPNIIMIMNESFADLRDVGAFATNEEYMPYFRSLEGSENVVSGDLLVSTFGGGTATTEFEVLTGDTMAFLPFGSSPYQMYIKAALPGLVSGLEGQGYQTVAMHPYRASSWNREEVYERLGFDAQLYEDDFAADAGRLRTYISDSADYQKIIEIYENKQPGAPLFLFNVTMQNHGGYEPSDDANFEQRIHLTGQYEGKYPEVDQYLSLVKYSDDALKELVGYFSSVDEPTAIVFFGDHQPNVPSAFYDDLYGNTDAERTREEKQAKLITPFFIWANYDIAEAENVQISANYLAAYALEMLGCSTSGYDALRLATRAQVPRINSYGYYTADGEWYDAQTAADYEALSDYHMAQYAQLFDTTNRVDTWYEPQPGE